jgi:uncharacterized protein (TIGR03435 family)
MREQRAAVLVIAMVPAITAAQFGTDVGPAVDPNTRFEVVAIKAFHDAGGRLLNRVTPGGFESNLPVGMHLRQALQKPDYQIVGAPGWIDTERYAINAKKPEGLPPSGQSVMLLNLLKDRFQLRTHLETRELPIFNLVMAREDGRPGPDLTVTSAECQATIEARLAAARAAASGGPPPPRPPFPAAGDALPCGFGAGGTGMAAGSGRTIAQIAQTLADIVGRPVIDKTGLTGMYDFALKFTFEGRLAGPLGLLGTPQPPGTPAAPIDLDSASLSVALQEQLGLKLESDRGPVEVVVIDRLEKPTLE